MYTLYMYLSGYVYIYTYIYALSIYLPTYPSVIYVSYLSIIIRYHRFRNLAIWGPILLQILVER